MEAARLDLPMFNDKMRTDREKTLKLPPLGGVSNTNPKQQPTVGLPTLANKQHNSVAPVASKPKAVSISSSVRVQQLYEEIKPLPLTGNANSLSNSVDKSKDNSLTAGVVTTAVGLPSLQHPVTASTAAAAPAHYRCCCSQRRCSCKRFKTSDSFCVVVSSVVFNARACDETVHAKADAVRTSRNIQLLADLFCGSECEKASGYVG
jgi:hypothetical protein